MRNFSIFLAILVYGAGFLCAAPPLESGFVNAPSALALPEEKDAAYRNARSQLIAAAAKYEHTPYRYGGLDRRGLDCSGLVYLSFRDSLGVSVPRSAQSMFSWVERIAIEKAYPGDLVFFRTAGNGSVSHVGIYVGNGRFIHSASEGPVTGVVFSRLDDQYWARTYAGAGRALPAAAVDGLRLNDGDSNSDGGSGTRDDARGKKPARAKKRKTAQSDFHFLFGLAAAPTWGTFFADSGVIRGAAGQLRAGAALTMFKMPMIFGFEIRPEWDGALGVFRLPFTLSWGYNDKLRIFAGPALSFGDAALSVSGESRTYSGGTSWFGAAGVTVAPFSINIAGNNLEPYAELAWQSYFSNNNEANIGADISAGFRVSTGLRFTWKK